jgi:Ku protein
MIRETIRSLDKVALACVVLTNREHVIALEAREKGLMGMLLRYPYEVRDASEYFDEIQDVKIIKDMLDLARHIVEQKSGHFEPERFEDHYEAAHRASMKRVTPSSKLSAMRCTMSCFSRLAVSDVVDIDHVMDVVVLQHDLLLGDCHLRAAARCR